MYDVRPAGNRVSYDPPVSLPEMTRKALEVLGEDPDGFFLFVEEAVDSMGRMQNATHMLEAGRTLDRSVMIAKDYAEKDDHTLLILMGDHKCCDVVVEDPSEDGDAEDAEDGPFPMADSDRNFVVDRAATYHTAQDVPTSVTVIGPEPGSRSGRRSRPRPGR